MEAGATALQEAGDGAGVRGGCEKLQQAVSRPECSDQDLLPRYLFVVTFLLEPKETIGLARFLEIPNRDAEVIERFVGEKGREGRGGHGSYFSAPPGTRS